MPPAMDYSPRPAAHPYCPLVCLMTFPVPSALAWSAVEGNKALLEFGSEPDLRFRYRAIEGASCGLDVAQFACLCPHLGCNVGGVIGQCAGSSRDRLRVVRGRHAGDQWTDRRETAQHAQCLGRRFAHTVVDYQRLVGEEVPQQV